MSGRSKENLNGKKYNSLSVIGFDFEKSKIKKRPFWKCKCDCGQIKSISAKHLKGNNVKTCGGKIHRIGKNNGNWKNESYQSTCFFYHGKKCLICEESKIVAAHHVNGNHNDNRPENLVPLCPTHHQYVHSKHKNEVQPSIEKYLNNYLRMV